MPKFLIRIVALFLVPALIADPTMAAALSPRPFVERRADTFGAEFMQQALSDAAEQVHSPILFSKIRITESGVARKVVLWSSLTIGAGLLAAQGTTQAAKSIHPIASQEILQFLGHMLVFMGVMAASFGFGIAAAAFRERLPVNAKLRLSMTQLALDEETRYQGLLDDGLSAGAIAKLKTAAAQQHLSNGQIEEALKRSLTYDEKQYLQTIRQRHERFFAGRTVVIGSLVGFCGFVLTSTALIEILHVSEAAAFINVVLTVAGLILQGPCFKRRRMKIPLLKTNGCAGRLPR